MALLIFLLVGASAYQSITKFQSATSWRNHTYEVKTLVQETPGAMTPEQYRAMVADLVNYLEYMGEPARDRRILVGIVVLLFLGVLFALVYWTKREYWKDVH